MPFDSAAPAKSLLDYAFDSTMPFFPSKPLYYFGLYFVRTERRNKAPYASLVYIARERERERDVYIYIYIYFLCLSLCLSLHFLKVAYLDILWHYGTGYQRSHGPYQDTKPQQNKNRLICLQDAVELMSFHLSSRVISTNSIQFVRITHFSWTHSNVFGRRCLLLVGDLGKVWIKLCFMHILQVLVKYLKCCCV